MKRIHVILFALFLFLSSGQLWAQREKLPYQPMAMFKGDTIQYLEFNYRIRWEQYRGKTVDEILKELEYPVLYIADVAKTLNIGSKAPIKVAGLGLSIWQAGKEPHPMKDYYITVYFENPPLLSDFSTLYDRQNPVFTSQIYDFIKDMKVLGVNFNPFIIKDPEILKREKQRKEEAERKGREAEKQWKERRRKNGYDSY